MGPPLDTRSAFNRTIDAKPNEVSIVKPGELVDVVEMTPLTLTDRRIYNLLLANAWDAIAEPIDHKIPKRDLQQTLHKGTDRLGDSIERLMSAIVKVRLQRDGKWETERVNLLGPNSEPDASDGFVRYSFDPKLRKIILESTVFARLHKKIMFALSSKYSLALYEMIQKRGNMTRSYEEFTIKDLRGFLGVPEDKLSSWINLRNKAIDPAVKEVSGLSDFEVRYEPIRSTEKGKTKSIAAVKLIWSRKTDLKDVVRELNNTKVGRRARINGAVESVAFGPATAAHFALRPDTLEKAKSMIPGYDIYAVEADWKRWAQTKGELPERPDGAFIAFCKTYAKNNPL